MSDEKQAEPKWKFETQLKGKDYLTSLEGETREGFIIVVRMAAKASSEPKLTPKDILDLPINEFQELVAEFKKQTGFGAKKNFLE